MGSDLSVLLCKMFRQLLWMILKVLSWKLVILHELILAIFSKKLLNGRDDGRVSVEWKPGSDSLQCDESIFNLELEIIISSPLLSLSSVDHLINRVTSETFLHVLIPYFLCRVGESPILPLNYCQMSYLFTWNMLKMSVLWKEPGLHFINKIGWFHKEGT